MEMKAYRFLKDIVCFDPANLARLLGCKKTEYWKYSERDKRRVDIEPKKESIKELTKKANDYIKEHPEIENSLKKPKNYMIADYYLTFFDEREGLEKITKSVRICEDIELLLLIFGKTINLIYSPNRITHFEDRSFNNILYFKKDEIEEV